MSWGGMRGGIRTYLVVFAVLEIASAIAFLAAAGFSPATLNDPLRLVAVGDVNGGLLRAGALLDMFGYLSAVPLALYLRERYHGEAAIDLFTFAGIVSLILGALGAVILAFGAPPLFHEYATASAGGRDAVAATFGALHHIVFSGLWQTLDAILDAVWLGGIGRLAWKHGAVTLGSALMAVGAVAAGAALAHIFGVFPSP